jgi:hypothetical protein
VKLYEKPQQRSARVHLGQPVVAVQREATSHLGVGQSVGAALEGREARIGGAGVRCGERHVNVPYSHRR